MGTSNELPNLTLQENPAGMNNLGNTADTAGTLSAGVITPQF